MTVFHRVRIAYVSIAALLLGTVWALLAMPVAAFAVPDEIGGCDHIFDGQASSEDGAVDILTVSGKDGETVYLEIHQADGRVIASHLAYTLHDDDGVVDEDGKVVGVVSVTSAAGVSLDGATVQVYENRAQSQLAWEGTVATVYARLDHNGETVEVPLAVRTLGNGEERPFVAPGTLGHGGAVYALAGDAPTVEDGRVIYAYAVSGETAASVDGHIRYYDAKNPAEPIKVDTIAGIGLNTSREVSISDVIAANGHAYRTIQLADQVTLSYPGATEYSVQCLRLADGQGQGDAYKAKINYVDAKGKTLGVTDSVIVDRRYLYTPPTRLHVRGDDDKFATYVLSDDNDLSDGGAIVLEPGQAEGVREINVVYVPLADDAERTWTVVLVNGSVPPSDPGREIKRVTYRGKAGESVSYATEATIDADGTTLVPATFAESVYEHTFSVTEDQIDQMVYYVPDGWTEPDPYEIKVNYVNIATNGVISSESYTATPTMRHDLEILTPATFDKDDTEYVRLNGQNLSIRHSFYSANRTYNVYYRETGDDLHTKTVIRSVRIEYIDPETGDTVYRPTTFVPRQETRGDASDAPAGTRPGAGTGTTTRTTTGTTPRATDSTPAATIPRDVGTSTGIGTTPSIVSIINDDMPQGLVTSEGADLATIRIEDNETPLTSDFGDRGTPKGTEGDGTDTNPSPVGHVIGIGIGTTAVLGVAALILVFFVRRRGRDDEPTYGNGTRVHRGTRR